MLNSDMVVVHYISFLTKLALSNENMPAFSISSSLRVRKTRAKDCGFFSRWLTRSCHNL